MPERNTRRDGVQGNPVEQTPQPTPVGDHPHPSEALLRSIITGTSTARTGTEFFAQLTHSLAQALGVRYAFVGEVVSPEQPTRVRTKAVCDSGTIVDNIEYDLTGTPCEGVVGGEPALYPAGVQQRFPEDHLLVEMSVEGYVGVPLADTQGQRLGLLVAMHDRTIPDSELTRSILSVFASRAASELERLKAENALRESETQFRTLLDTVDHIAWLAAPDGSCQLYISRAAEQVYGRPVSDFYENPRLWLQAVHPQDHAIVKESAEKLDDFGRAEAEYRIVRPDGEIRWLLDRKFLVHDGTGKPVHKAGTAIDITDRKRAEQRLKQLERDKQIILDSSSELIVYQDLNHRVLWANREACRSVDKNPEELVGRFCYDIWQGRAGSCDNCPVQKALETGTQHTEMVATPDGRVWWIRGFPVCDDEGRVTGATEFTLDITEWKRAEAKLLESEQRLRTLFEHAPEAVVIFDADTGCYVDAKDNATQLFGLDWN
ncbi:MAG TPA: PAS domain S-box protein, partial [Acidobacteriota bacterium]|nr:PAS domain S-box protein [Acidobacteriota bacterium]